MTIAEAMHREDKESIRVLLVDDHEHVLWGLGKLIEGEWPRMTVSGSARTAAQALALVAERRTDVVVLDLWLGEETSLPHLAGLQAFGAAVLVLTGVRDASLLERAFAAGARAVVFKDDPAALLLIEIERAHRARSVSAGNGSKASALRRATT
ncbi:MAG TPA: response regulator transcription factor [Burkholderiales bacterium]|jgi:two-component system, NarL family, nitrate/nitrite response regulator NarL|nr:response regulator transcription factor [Burkholderiales bacterium]